MNFLIAYYSRSGHTERLALRLGDVLETQGHSVTFEKILLAAPISKWRLIPPLLSFVPALPFYLCIPSFRRWWIKRYVQPELSIARLRYPDVSSFDRICIGGPKWLYIAYPLARYLKTVKGLSGKTVGAFATFCGPPLKHFELEMLFSPLLQRVAEKGGHTAATLSISSHFHEFFFFNEVEYLFRLISRLAFRRSLRSFTLDSEWGRQNVSRFCKKLTMTD